MFDWLDPVGSIANKSLGIPKTGVTTSADPSNIGEMITSRIPGANGGSISQATGCDEPKEHHLSDKTLHWAQFRRSISPKRHQNFGL